MLSFSHSFHPSLGGYILKSFAVIAHALRDKLALYGLDVGVASVCSSY